jgi:mono/diheme cytochrome c family protein
MSRPAKLLSLASLLAALAVFSGCDAQENADLDNGRTLFSEQCGRCHILAEAGSAGEVGPDLDAAFAAARDAGMDNDTIEGVVEQQIESPRNVDVDNPTYMPPGLVTGDDARDVAAYVASVAGVPGIQPPTAPGGPGGQVFASNGCGNCHALAAAGSTGQVGPNLDEDLPGQDPAAIEQSIVDPNADIVQGFQPGIMPENYGADITPEDLKLLVDFLATCAGEKVGCGEEGGSGGSQGG